MRRSNWMRAALVGLALTTTATGCMSTVGSRPAVVRQESTSEEMALIQEQQDGECASPECLSNSGGANKVRGRGGALAALFFLGAVIIVGAAIVDLLILPATHHHAFPCCRAVAHTCWR